VTKMNVSAARRRGVSEVGSEVMGQGWAGRRAR
jgi:hypothetical protein